MKRVFLWLIAAAFAASVFAFTCAKNGAENEIDGVTQDDSGRRVTTWIDPMYSQGAPHLYKSKHPGVAPDCGMKLVPVYAEEKPAGAHAQTSTPAVKLAIVERRDLSRTFRTTGRVAVDERSTAQVHAKFEGVIKALYVNFTGQPVRRGEPLLAIYSPDLLATQNELILAERNQSELGRTLASAARTRLRLWDMSAADIDRVARSGAAIHDVTLRSPAGGVVITKNAVAGARVMPSDTLYEIADLSHVWVLADIYESELPYIRIGGSAEVSIAGQTLAGRVTFISPILGAATRTATVRIEIDNRAGLLKPDMYAAVQLHEPIGNVLAVPDSAVMNSGTRMVAFVPGDDGSPQPREITTGAKSDGYLEIRSGLREGEHVIFDANFLVDSESRLRTIAGQK